MNAKTHQALEKHFEYQHKNPPPAFNQDARPGLADAVSERYSAFCEANPNATQEDRRQEYRKFMLELAPKFPSYREMNEVR